jgi:hypothetical protein
MEILGGDNEAKNLQGNAFLSFVATALHLYAARDRSPEREA